MTNATGDVILDRSRAQLRLPADKLDECLRMAHEVSLSAPGNEPTMTPTDDDTMARLEAAGVMSDGRFDPVAEEILSVINEASLVVAIDLRFADDNSVPTIWATPRHAIVSSSLDPESVEFRPVDVAQLPQVLGELVVLRSPRFVGEAPMSIGTEILDRVADMDDAAKAHGALLEGGLDEEQAERVWRFLGRATRHWEIQSTWSTEGGQESAELRGLDAGPDGQWLKATTGGADGPGQVNFTPQGHGEVMKAFRSVMPRNWIGTPLNRPPV